MISEMVGVPGDDRPRFYQGVQRTVTATHHGGQLARPGWLRAVAVVNPLTYAVDASRALSLARSATTGVLSAVAVSAALVLIAGRLAIVGFRRPS